MVFSSWDAAYPGLRAHFHAAGFDAAGAGRNHWKQVYDFTPPTTTPPAPTPPTTTTTPSERERERERGGQSESAGASPYMIFCKAERPKIIKANPSMAFGEVGKALGAAWGKLSDAQKAKFKN